MLASNVSAKSGLIDSTAKTFNIGDQVPDLEFSNIINHDGKTIKLSDLKGKIVLLDFWATWCTPCIKSFPKMDSLQMQFKDDLVILPISYEPFEKVNKAWKDIEYIKGSNLPLIYDTNMHTYFAYRMVPHVIWIDRNGKIAAMTDNIPVTTENVSSFIAKGKIDLEEKRDILERNFSRPFLAGQLGDYKFEPEQVLYSSTIIEGIDAMSSAGQFSPGRSKYGTLHLIAHNKSIQDLFKNALINIEIPNREFENPKFYSNLDFYLNMYARIQWEAKDSTHFWSINTSTAERFSKMPVKDLCFNFELILPIQDSLYFKEYMLHDLNRYFGSRFGLEGLRAKRKVKCYALTVVGPESLFKSKGGASNIDLNRGIFEFRVKNMRVDDILFYWISFHQQRFKYPIINETNYILPIDFDLGVVDPSDFYAVNEALKKCGLEFKLVERDLDMIVIRDRQP